MGSEGGWNLVEADEQLRRPSEPLQAADLRLSAEDNYRMFAETEISFIKNTRKIFV